MRGLTRLGLAGAVILATAVPLHAWAQQAAAPTANNGTGTPQVAAPVIITVDVQQILRDSLVAKDVQAQMDQRTDRYTKEVSSQENDLQKTQDELEQERTKLEPDAFNTRMREFQQRYDTLDNRVQATRQGLQQSYNDAMTKVENTALQIIADIAAERKANLVVAKAAVLFEAQELDITQEVIKRLDAKLPKVDLAPPQIPPPPGAGSVSGSVPGSGAAGAGQHPLYRRRNRCIIRPWPNRAFLRMPARSAWPKSPSGSAPKWPALPPAISCCATSRRSKALQKMNYLSSITISI